MSGTRVNGYHYSWSSIGFKKGAADVDYLTGVDFTPSRAIGKVRGAGASKKGRVRDAIDYVGSLTWRKEDFVAQIANKEAFADDPFDLFLNVKEGSFPLITIELLGVLIIDGSQGWSPGPDVLSVQTSVDIMDIKVNGNRWFGEGILHQ